MMHNHEYLNTITQTQFDIRSRLQQLILTEPDLLRRIICSQLFKSFVQTPSITESPSFPRSVFRIVLNIEIAGLITELRQNPQSDILRALHILNNTGLQFSALLEWMIHEVIEEGDIENMPLFGGMQDGSTIALPALNPWVANFIANAEVSENTSLELNFLNLLEEVSIENRLTRV